jgi:hypothetical protein
MKMIFSAGSDIPFSSHLEAELSVGGKAASALADISLGRPSAKDEFAPLGSADLLFKVRGF